MKFVKVGHKHILDFFQLIFRQFHVHRSHLGVDKMIFKASFSDWMVLMCIQSSGASPRLWYMHRVLLFGDKAIWHRWWFLSTTNVYSSVTLPLRITEDSIGLQYIKHKITSQLRAGNQQWTLTTGTTQGLFILLMISAMYNIPVFCVVQNSYFHCCTKFLFSVLYKIPIFQ